MEFDLPGVGLTQVVMQQFCNLSDDFTIARTSAEGTREEHYVPTLVTYEVMSATTPRGTTEDVSGTFVFFRHHVQGTMYVAGSQWEVRPSEDDAHLQAHVSYDYLVFDINKSIAENSFTCAVEDASNLWSASSSRPVNAAWSRNAWRLAWTSTTTP